MRRTLLPLVAALLAPALAPPARAQPAAGSCEALLARPGETAIGLGEGRCYLDLKWAGPGYRDGRIWLDRREGSEACAAVDMRRGEEGQRETRGAFQDFAAPYGERGFDLAAPQYAVEGADRVVTIHPARYLLNSCQAGYEYRGTASYTGDPVIRGEAVPPEVIEDIRERARATMAALGGNPSAPPVAPDAERQLVEALGPQIGPALRELAELGLLEIDDLDLLRQSLARDPEARRTGAAFLGRIGVRNPSDVTGARRQVAMTIVVAVQLARVRDVNEQPAFPGSTANLPILMELGMRAVTHPDPVVAHEALTAMERYAAMLRDLDVKTLKERHGMVPASPPTVVP